MIINDDVSDLVDANRLGFEIIRQDLEFNFVESCHFARCECHCRQIYRPEGRQRHLV